jgi:sulfatase maturation enzyme AslB (radical SAM superfamily)
MPLRRRELATGLVLNLSGKDQSLTAQDHDLLRRASVVRIDPSNSCNATCVFCDSSFSARGARLPLAVFEEALDSLAGSPHLDTLQFGCTYEPTIRKDFSAFGRALERSGAGLKAQTVTIVSNCWLLHRHDLEPFVRAGLNKLHVSLHAHEAAAFEQVMGKPELDRVAANLKAFKAAWPDVPVSAVCVVNRLNAAEPLAFARWAFFELGVDYLRFTRAKVMGDKPNSPAKAALQALAPGQGYELDDEAWRAFAVQVAGAPGIGLDLIEGEQNLKNSRIVVDALRLKRKGWPMEAVASRRDGAARPRRTLARWLPSLVRARG